jgi:hypothetical protein
MNKLTSKAALLIVVITLVVTQLACGLVDTDKLTLEGATQNTSCVLHGTACNGK